MSLPAWDRRAACRNQTPETFFLVTYQPASANVRAAKTICQGCPVVADCLAWALANPQLASDGIWGGTTPIERAAIRRTADTEGTTA
ncbi:WhiB family transcriptional regulator [Nonomuraea sp. NPDC048882]|uniref:WhiB family transcriptional regulator n=1 Tax=Nonomuraea sp. NPDC048882 TaxID=3154347 RepID=UPI0033F4D609